MSFQYIYTSAKRGLEPGKSGFCCVARSRDTPPDLIQEFDQQSSYFQSVKGDAPAILRYRIAHIRSGKYHILTRIQESGTDYSKRNNHIAHHLAFTSGEIATLPNPASILLAWLKWRSEWSEPPRVLDKDDAFDLNHVNTKWSSEDSYGGFPPAIKYGEILSRSFEVSSEEEIAIVEHFRDSLKELRFKEQWEYPFTNVLLPIDRPNDYIWSGAWSELTYPYEVDFNPKPIESPTKQSTAVPPEEPEPTPPAVETKENVMKRAPVVEIPEEFDRKKRRRPKRKFGIKEFSKSINYALLISTILCIAIAFFFYWNNQDDVETLIQEKRGIAVKPTLTPTQRATQSWNSFAERNYPIAELSKMAGEAQILAKIGDTQPTATIEFLDLLSSSQRLVWPNQALVPVTLLDQNVENNAFKLVLSVDEYPNINTLSLIPKRVASRIETLDSKIANLTSSFAPLSGTVYEPNIFSENLRSFYELAGQNAFHLDKNTREAMDRFFSEKSAILQNEKYSAFLNIHHAFGLPNSAAYLSISSEGLLSSSADTSFATYIISLFTNHVLAHYSSIRNTASFRTAFSRIDPNNFENAYEASQAIYEAILVGEPTENELRTNWTEIRNIWTEAFIRSDLMEETIVSYTIEALENSKKSLAELQTQFTAEDIEKRSKLLELSQEIESIAKLSQSISKNEEWIVFNKQTTKAASESP